MAIKTVISKSGKVYQYDASKYKYKHKSTRGKTLVGKSGKVNKKNIDALKADIDLDPRYNKYEKMYLKADLDALVKKRHIFGEKLTTSGFFGKQADDSISRMFINAGYDPELAAAMYGIDLDALLDPANWTGSTFIYGNKTYEFKFTYTDDILVEV